MVLNAPLIVISALHDTAFLSYMILLSLRILEAIHETPANRWTFDNMAELAHLSRSAFTSNFREAVGESPMLYLTSWRMNLARSLLRTTGLPLDVIAKRVGFRTRAGFNKALQQSFGIALKKLRAQKA